MLSFFSANVRIANSRRAMEECLDTAFSHGVPRDCLAIVLNATLGHRLDKLAAALGELAPGVPVFGSSCSGVIGREGVGESMSDVAMMAVCGPPEELATASVTGIYGRNAYEKGLALARELRAKNAGIRTIYLLCPGIDIANDLVVAAFVETFGEEVEIFGGTSSDNMRGLVNYQYHDGVSSEHDAWAIGLADPTLKSVTRATHGFSAWGDPMVVTKAEGHIIRELDGEPAWQRYTNRLSLPASAICGDTIPVGALAEALPKNLVEEYGNPHILRVITKYDADGSIYYPVTCTEGLGLWLTSRDEDLIFSEQRRSLDYLTEKKAAANL